LFAQFWRFQQVLALCLLVSCAVAQQQGGYSDYADYAEYSQAQAQPQRPAPRAINRPQELAAPKPTPVAILKQINRYFLNELYILV